MKQLDDSTTLDVYTVSVPRVFTVEPFVGQLDGSATSINVYTQRMYCRWTFVQRVGPLDVTISLARVVQMSECYDVSGGH